MGWGPPAQSSSVIYKGTQGLRPSWSQVSCGTQNGRQTGRAMLMGPGRVSRGLLRGGSQRVMTCVWCSAPGRLTRHQVVLASGFFNGDWAPSPSAWCVVTSELRLKARVCHGASRCLGPRNFIGEKWESAPNPSSRSSLSQDSTEAGRANHGSLIPTLVAKVWDCVGQCGCHSFVLVSA